MAVALQSSSDPELELDDPAEAARDAGLAYVSDTATGIRRQRSRDGFRYLDLGGRTVGQAERLTRIRSLATALAKAA